MFYQFIQSDPKKSFPFFHTLSLRYINEIRTNRKVSFDTTKMKQSPIKKMRSNSKITDFSLQGGTRGNDSVHNISIGSNNSKNSQDGDDDDYEKGYKEVFIIKPYFIPEEEYELIVNGPGIEGFLASKFTSITYNLLYLYKNIENVNSKIVENLKEIKEIPPVYHKYIIPELQKIKKDEYSTYSSNSLGKLTKILSSDNPEEIKIKEQFKLNVINRSIISTDLYV